VIDARVRYSRCQANRAGDSELASVRDGEFASQTRFRLHEVDVPGISLEDDVERNISESELRSFTQLTQPLCEVIGHGDGALYPKTWDLDLVEADGGVSEPRDSRHLDLQSGHRLVTDLDLGREGVPRREGYVPT